MKQLKIDHYQTHMVIDISQQNDRDIIKSGTGILQNLIPGDILRIKGAAYRINKVDMREKGQGRIWLTTQFIKVRPAKPSDLPDAIANKFKKLFRKIFHTKQTLPEK